MALVIVHYFSYSQMCSGIVHYFSYIRLNGLLRINLCPTLRRHAKMCSGHMSLLRVGYSDVLCTLYHYFGYIRCALIIVHYSTFRPDSRVLRSCHYVSLTQMCSDHVHILRLHQMCSGHCPLLLY
ncbi:hypothetical protein BASA62_007390 [Batrachochytrium salamandrivorans]|nr:hypothetical protein BASA62_007390 [Batrachochytrium salamandrivorans]